MNSERNKPQISEVTEGDQKPERHEKGPASPWSLLSKRLGKIATIAAVLLGTSAADNQEKLRQNAEKRELQIKHAIQLVEKFDKRGIHLSGLRGRTAVSADDDIPDNIDGFIATVAVWKDKPFAKDIFRRMVSLDYGKAMNIAGIIKDKPFAQNFFSDFAENDSRFLESGSIFIDMPYGERLIGRAIQSYPWEFFRNVEKYRASPSFHKLLKKCIDISLAKGQVGSLLEYFDSYQGDIPDKEKFLKQIVTECLENDPVALLEFHTRYAHFPNRDDIISRSVARALFRDAFALFRAYPSYQELSQGKDIVARAADVVSRTNPDIAIRDFHYYQDHPDAKRILQQAAQSALRQDSAIIIFRFPILAHEPYAQDMLREAARLHPIDILSEVKNFEHTSGAQEIVESAILHSPNQALIHFSKIEKFLRKSTNQRIKKVLFTLEHLRDTDQTDRYFFIPKESEGTREVLFALSPNSWKEGASFSGDERAFFEALIRIKASPDHIGDFDVDARLAQESLRSVRSMNDRHNEPDARRFESIKNLNASEIYTFIVYGDQELFTSSFNGLFKRLVAQMKSENVSGEDLLAKVGKNKFRTFLRLCASYNRLDQFLAIMDTQAQQEFLADFVRDIEQEKGMLAQAVTVADVFSIIRDPKILEVFQRAIKDEYDRVQKEGSTEGMSVYGLLAGMFGERAVINEAWLLRMAKKYKIPDVQTLSSEKIFDRTNTSVQQYYFYNDKDGELSFESFLSSYAKNSGWKIEDRNTYIVITKEHRGKHIEIFANKPAKESIGQKDIEEELKKQKKTVSVYVHRGHSYHADQSIEQIRSQAVLVSLGSCGGYTNVDAVLSKAPTAHIISTKGTGTMKVNDPILKALNEEILAGKDISWPVFWERVEGRLGGVSEFKDYVPPHKNLGVLFLKAYRQIMDSTSGSSAPTPQTAE